MSKPFILVVVHGLRFYRLCRVFKLPVHTKFVFSGNMFQYGVALCDFHISVYVIWQLKNIKKQKLTMSLSKSASSFKPFQYGCV